MFTLATVTLKAKSGIAKDDTVNTLCVKTGADTSTAFGEVTVALASFFNGTNDGGALGSIGQYIGHSRSRLAGGMEFRLYDVPADFGSGPMGSPIFEDTGTLVAGSGATPLPEEVAVCCTLLGEGRDTAPVETPDGPDADSLIDRPKQRHTGRIYLGPFSTEVVSVTGNGQAKVGLISPIILSAIERLQTQLAANGHALYVWSRKGTSMYPVYGAFVDDAFDTQRRRGMAPTTRSINIF
jgi:hypothetical protein